MTDLCVWAMVLVGVSIAFMASVLLSIRATFLAIKLLGFHREFIRWRIYRGQFLVWYEKEVKAKGGY